MVDESVLQTKLVTIEPEQSQGQVPNQADAGTQAAAANVPPQAAPTPTFEEQFKERLGLDFDAAKERLTKEQEDFHPLAKGVNQLLKEGKDAVALQKYLRIQQLDIDKMTPEQVVKEQLAANNPTLSQAHIDALYDSEYGASRHDDETATLLKEAKLQQVAEKAKQELFDRRVQMQPTTVKNEADNALRSVTMAAWQPIAPTILNSLATLPVSAKTDAGELSLDFVPNLTPEESNFVQSQVVAYAAANNLPITQETTTQLRGLAERMIKTMRFDQILEAALRDVEAAYKEMSTRQIANQRPVQNGSGVAPAKPIAEQIQRPPGMV